MHRRRLFQNWQPPRCIFHEYNKKDIVECLEDKRIVIVGDSTTRQVYWALLKKLDKEAAEIGMQELQRQTDLIYTKDHVKLEFIWDPFLNSTRLFEEVAAYQQNPTAVTSSAAQIEDATESAAILLLGTGLWYARHIHDDSVKQFRHAID